MKKKIVSIIVIVISIVLIILVDKNVKKESIKEETIEEKEDKAFDVVKNIMLDKDIFKYAKDNKLDRMSISDIKSKLKKDISKFNKLYYNCNPNTSFVVFNDDYTDYTMYLDCKVFYEDRN